MTGSGWETLTGVSEAFQDVREWSGGLPDGWEAITGGQEALPDVREWSGGFFGCLGVIGRTSWMSRSGREAHPDVRVWTGGLTGGREAPQ